MVCVTTSPNLLKRHVSPADGDDIRFQMPPLSAERIKNLEAFNTRVLLVDDSVMNRMLFKRMLTSLGFKGKVVEVEDGKLAVEKFQSLGEKVRLIFMDIHMPNMDGLEATRQIREFEESKGFSSVPIVCIGASGNTLKRKRDCRDSGMDDTIEKPFQKSQILSAFDQFVPIRKISDSKGEK